MSNLKSNWNNFVISLSKNLNAINAALTGKVSTQIFNNQTNLFTSSLTTLTNDLNEVKELLEFYDGMHFVADQANSLIYLKNSKDEKISEINVGFLNNEGTTFFYNSNTQQLELKNDQGQVLSTIPISNFVTNLANNLSFNSTSPFTLELKNSNGTVASSVNININNVQNLESRLNSLRTIYTNDDTITGNRNITLGDKSLRFSTNTDVVEIKDNKITIPNLFTNKYNSTQSGQILNFILNNNLPKIILGNADINELEINSKNYLLKNLKLATNQNRTLVINENGELAYINGQGAGSTYTAGEGIEISSDNVISIKESVDLIFNW